MKQVHAPRHNLPERILHTREEACRLLAVSKNTLHRLVAKREIPVVRFSRRLHFRRTDLERFVDLKRKATRSDSSYGSS